MGFGGGGGGGSSTQIIQPPDPGQNTPLQGPLASAGQNMLTQALPFAHSGAGYQLLPRNPYGQVYVPGPNPTIFGDPFNQQYAQNYFGPNSGQGNSPAMAPPAYMGGAPTGGAGGGSGGAPQSSAGMTPGLPSPLPMGGYQPPMGGPVHPLVQLLQGLTQPGTLGNLFAQFSNSMSQQPRPQQNQEGAGRPPATSAQPPQQGGSSGDSK